MGVLIDRLKAALKKALGFPEEASPQYGQPIAPTGQSPAGGQSSYSAPAGQTTHGTGQSTYSSPRAGPQQQRPSAPRASSTPQPPDPFSQTQTGPGPSAPASPKPGAARYGSNVTTVVNGGVLIGNAVNCVIASGPYAVASATYDASGKMTASSVSDGNNAPEMAAQARQQAAKVGAQLRASMSEMNAAVNEASAAATQAASTARTATLTSSSPGTQIPDGGGRSINIGHINGGAFVLGSGTARVNNFTVGGGGASPDNQRPSPPSPPASSAGNASPSRPPSTPPVINPPGGQTKGQSL